jgi:nitroreductase
MDALTALHTRTASPRLTDPAPAGEQLEKILKAGLRAPDHGMLRPWRFLLVEGDDRQKLGQLFVDVMQPADEEKRTKLLSAPLRAPLVIICVATVRDNPKIPAVEQIGSMAAAIQNMSVAIHALGFGSIWRTGPPSQSNAVKRALGFADKDEIVGFLYVGTPTFAERPVPENRIADFVGKWTG